LIDFDLVGMMWNKEESQHDFPPAPHSSKGYASQLLNGGLASCLGKLAWQAAWGGV
jgi:hypothetical protein